MKRYLFLACIVPAIAGAQGARPLTLDEAVKLAQKNAQSTIAARNSVNQNEVAVRTAWASFLPDLSVSAGANQTGGSTYFQGQLVPLRGDPWSYSRSLSSNLTIFDAGKRIFQLSAAQANVSTAEANEVLANYNVALQVSTQYYAVLAAREESEAAKAQLTQAQEEMKSANARVAAGAATKSDSLRSVIAVGQARLAELTAENDLQVANASLTRYVGTSYVVTAVADSLTDQAITIDSTALVLAIEAAPAVVAARSAVTSARATLRASRTPYLPTLSASMSTGGSNSSKTFDWGSGQYNTSNSLRLSISFPLFDRLVREQSIANSSIAENNTEASLRDVRLFTQQQLVTYLGSLRLAQANIQIQLASVDAAQEDLRVQQQRYALGATTLLDLLTSQSALNTAVNQLIRARRDARIAKADIESLLAHPIK